MVKKIKPRSPIRFARGIDGIFGMEQRYALEKVPSPVRIKAEGGLQQTLSSEISPPPSPKRKRDPGFQDDMLDVAFTAVLPPRKSDLPRSQSTF